MIYSAFGEIPMEDITINLVVTPKPVKLFDAYRKFGSLEKANAYLNRVLDANQSVLKEVLSMMSAAVQRIFFEHFEKEGVLNSAAVRRIIFEHLEKDGTLDRIREDKVRDAALEMLKDGVTPDKVAHYLRMPLEWVQSLI